MNFVTRSQTTTEMCVTDSLAHYVMSIRGSEHKNYDVIS